MTPFIGIIYVIKSTGILIYLIVFLRAFPAVNPGVFRAGILIGAPDCGFLPVLAALFRTEKVPKPVTITFSPLLRASEIAPNTAVTASLAALLVKSTFFATTSIRSDFVI